MLLQLISLQTALRARYCILTSSFQSPLLLLPLPDVRLCDMPHRGQAWAGDPLLC
jgi:hypothetical protein